MKKYIVSLILLLVCYTGFSQPAIGKFKSHLPYNSFHTVAFSEEYVYAANYYSIMLLSLKDNSTSYWSKVEELSDVGITKLAYDQATKILVVGYENGNIDLIKNGKILNLPDIKNKALTGSKAIRKIKIMNKTAYLLCDFGVSLLNLETQNFTDTWFTTIRDEKYPAKDIVLYRDRFYLATSSGLFSVPQNYFAIADFSRWEKNAELADTNIAILQVFSDIMVAAKGGGEKITEILFSRDAVSWQPTGWEHIDLCSIEPFGNDKIIVFDYSNYSIYDHNLDLYYSSGWDYAGAREGVVESEKNLWVASSDFGLSKVEVKVEAYGPFYSHNGPKTGVIGAITAFNGKVITVPGGYSRVGAPYYLPVSYSFYEYGKWHYLASEFYAWKPVIYDFADVIINPKDPDEVYIASWYHGLLRMKNNEVVEWFTEQNSALEKNKLVPPDSPYLSVSGLCFDAYNNLWMTNSHISKLLKVRKTDGSWASFDFGSIVTGQYGVVAEHLLVDPRNYKWITIPRNTIDNLIVFNDNNTIDNKSDDKMVSINMNGSGDGDASNTVTCIVEDRNGYIWLGTDRGIKVIYNPGAVFEQTVYPQRILLQFGEYAQYLFESERITCIAVDGANRKWVGTSKAGVFLISADGTEELLHFTEENSPLNSSEITAIAINHENGEVFIGTGNGLISYGGEATKGKEEYGELKIFPNPVREGYLGVISISGLMEDSFCKIADAAGNLVWQGYALGGQLIWNGKDFRGNRPATGVYFIFASSQSGKEKKVGKILFIN